jgi:hypothetical protein
MVVSTGTCASLFPIRYHDTFDLSIALGKTDHNNAQKYCPVPMNAITPYLLYACTPPDSPIHDGQLNTITFFSSSPGQTTKL